MALNDAAADAALNAWIDTMKAYGPPPDPPPPPFDPSPLGAPRALTAAERAPILQQFAPLVRAIFAQIRTSAEVLPDGTPAMTAEGDPVVGKGRIG